MTSKTCQVCKTEFSTPSKSAKYCSIPCRSEGIKKRKTQECLNCKNGFTVRPSEERLYCSRSCFHSHRNGDISRASRKRTRFCKCGESLPKNKTYCSPECRHRWGRKGGKPNNSICPCGNSIHLSAKGATRRFCQPECREKYGKSKIAHDVTLVCQSCEQEFVVKSYNSHRMFCSLKCSNTKPSYERRQHYKFGEVHVNGQFELRFLALCARHLVQWEPFDRSECVEVDGRSYGPDYKIVTPQGNICVEVKGWEGLGDQSVMYPHFRKVNSLAVVNEDALTALERLTGRASFLSALRHLSEQ